MMSMPTPPAPNTKPTSLGSNRPQALLFLLVSYLLWGSVSMRWIMEFIEQQHPLTWLITAMLLLFGLLMGLEPWITRGVGWRAHLYLAWQAGLVFAAALLFYELDFFALLYVPLCAQAMFLFSRRIGLLWMGILIAFTFAGQVVQFGWPQALPFQLLYIAALVFVAAYSALTQQAQESRRQSEKLLAELQNAHAQLQAYALQAEELAAVRERNRLARDLHDSVAQTLYGLMLEAEAAARHLATGQSETAADSLQIIRQSAHQTLQETRLLIFELLPQEIEKDGLAAALRTRLQAVEGRSGIKTRLNIAETPGLAPQRAAVLYRIAQEALNNSLKHARARLVSVSLQQAQGKVVLEIADDGVGFQLAQGASTGGMGLENMQARAAQIGARLKVDSTPGGGTRVSVEAPL